MNHPFFSHCAEAWWNLSDELKNKDSINLFKSSILNYSDPANVFAFNDIYGVKLLTWVS